MNLKNNKNTYGCQYGCQLKLVDKYEEAESQTGINTHFLVGLNNDFHQIANTHTLETFE